MKRCNRYQNSKFSSCLLFYSLKIFLFPPLISLFGYQSFNCGTNFVSKYCMLTWSELALLMCWKQPVVVSSAGGPPKYTSLAVEHFACYHVWSLGTCYLFQNAQPAVYFNFRKTFLYKTNRLCFTIRLWFVYFAVVLIRDGCNWWDSLLAHAI